MITDSGDLSDLRRARALLDNPGLAARLSSHLGSPIEKGFEHLPQGLRDRIGKLAHDGLQRAVYTASRSLAYSPPGPRARAARDSERSKSMRLHKLAGTLSGAAGGAFGLAGLAVEVPVSTIVIMRSILDIARAEGEDVEDPETRMAALEVFALGGGSESDDATESGYYAARALLAQSVGYATRHIAHRGLVADGAPALVRLLAVVAARYKIQLTQKAAGMLVPGIGAAAGAAINLMFIDHFQNVSRGHFTIRRLERKYGELAVRNAWTGLALPAPYDAPPHLGGA